MMPPAAPDPMLVPPDPIQPAKLPGALKDGAYWRGEIDRARAAMEPYVRWWEANLRAYAPNATQDPQEYGSCINTNRDFVLTERKKADLFYQRPDVTLQPSPLMEGPIMVDGVNPQTGQPGKVPLMGPPDPKTGQAQPIMATVALQSHEEIVNESLGPDDVDATKMVHQTLFDVLCLSGGGFGVMGYESTTVETPHPAGVLDPMTGQPQTVPVPIYEHCFWHHLSPKQAVVPSTWRSTEWDKAPYLGYKFTLPLTPGNRIKFKLPENFTGSRPDPNTQHFDHGVSTQPGEDVFTGTILWYRSCLYRTDRPHPDHLTKLVMVDGVDEPVIEVDSPDQTLDPKTGGLTPDSVIGFPIHPLNIRTLTDSAWVPSDCTVTRPLVNELNRFREQMVEYRDAQTLKWAAKASTLPRDVLAKIVRAPVGGIIIMPDEAFPIDQNLVELPHGSMARESFTSNDYIDNDIARSTAIDASGAGVQSTGSSTATEQQIVAANANARLDFERGVVLQWYVKGVTKYATYIQRYLPVQRAAEIVGPERAKVWDAWRKTAPSTCSFTALPDSALRVDQAVDRKQAQELYSYLANDPFIQKGRGKLLEKLLRKFHVDPQGIVQQPDPPKPEPPKVSLSFKGEDLVSPQGPMVIEILRQQGIQISDQALQASQAMAAQLAALTAMQAVQSPDTEHGGKLAPQESLSKHQSEQTGGMQGIGGQAALGAPGGHLQ